LNRGGPKNREPSGHPAHQRGLHPHPAASRHGGAITSAGHSEERHLRARRIRSRSGHQSHDQPVLYESRRSPGSRDSVAAGGDKRLTPSRCARPRCTRLPLSRQACRAAPDLKGRVSAIRSRSLRAAIAPAWAGTHPHEFAGSPLAVMGNAAPPSLMATIAGCGDPGQRRSRLDQRETGDALSVASMQRIMFR